MRRFVSSRGARGVGLALCAMGVAIGVVTSAGPALALDPTVAVEAGPVKRSAGENGTSEAKVEVANLEEGALAVTATAPDREGCVVDVDDEPIPASRSAAITLRLSSGCPTDEGIDVALTLAAGTTSRLVPLVLDPVESSSSVDWWILVVALGSAALIACSLPLLAQEDLKNLRDHQDDDDVVEKRRAAHRITQARRSLTLSALGLPSGAPGSSGSPAAPPAIGWSSTLGGLGTGWSLKESWVSNVTALAAALAAVAGGTDLLKGVLGEEPKSALSLIAVAGLLSALLVSMAPLVVKAVGDDVGTATVGGAVSAGAIVVTASFVQVIAVTIQTTLLVDGVLWQILLVGGGVLVGLVIWIYAARSISQLLSVGLAESPPELPVELEAAWVVARSRPTGNRSLFALGPRTFDTETEAGTAVAGEALWAAVEAGRRPSAGPRSAML